MGIYSHSSFYFHHLLEENMEIITCQAKRSGKGFIANSQELIGALESTKAKAVKVIDSVVFKKNLVEYLKAIGKNEVVKVIPYKGEFTYESLETKSEVKSKHGKGIKLTAGKFTARFLSQKLPEDNTNDIALLRFSTIKAEESLNAGELKNALKHALVCISKDGANPALEYVFFDSSDDFTNIIGADGYRMAITRTPRIAEIGNQILISKANAEKLLKVIAKADNVELNDKGNQIRIKTKSQILFIEKEFCQFPYYQQVLDNHKDNQIAEIVFKADDLLKALPGKVKSSLPNILTRLYWNKNLKYVIKEDDQELTGEAELVHSSGEAKFAMNYQYLMDMLKAFKGKEVVLAAREALNAQVFSAGNTTYVIMPMYAQL